MAYSVEHELSIFEYSKTGFVSSECRQLWAQSTERVNSYPCVNIIIHCTIWHIYYIIFQCTCWNCQIDENNSRGSTEILGGVPKWYDALNMPFL